MTGVLCESRNSRYCQQYIETSCTLEQTVSKQRILGRLLLLGVWQH